VPLFFYHAAIRAESQGTLSDLHPAGFAPHLEGAQPLARRSANLEPITDGHRLCGRPAPFHRGLNVDAE
jgi:hypothetical protein